MEWVKKENILKWQKENVSSGFTMDDYSNDLSSTAKTAYVNEKWTD